MGRIIAGLFEDVTSSVNAIMRRMLSIENGEDIDQAIQIARDYMPDGSNYSYEQEMSNRVDYYLGSMQSDMSEVIKRRFPDGYKDLIDEQVNLRLVRRLTLNKAKVFTDQGEVYLEGPDGKRADPDDPNEITFQEIAKKARLWSAFQQADVYTQLCHRAAVKPWFDHWRKTARMSIFPPHLVYIVPNDMHEYDADRAWVQIFTRVSADGYNSYNQRYEVWAIWVDEDGNYHTDHYIYDTKYGRIKLNPNDENPFVDPENDRPIYPMVWWQDDDVAQIYMYGDEDMLTMNRMINSGLTDLNNNIHFQAFGIPVYTMDDDAVGSPPPMRPLNPRKVVDLPKGLDLEFRSPDLDIEQVSSFWQFMVKLESLIDGQSPTALRVEGREAASGYALEIENMPLKEHVARLRPIMVPYAEETARRLIIVHNTYAPEHGLDTVADGYTPRVEPGEIQVPVNPEEQGRVYAAEIAADVSTPVDWRMARYDETREAATASVAANTAYNKEQASLSMPEINPAFREDPGEPPDDDDNEDDETENENEGEENEGSE